MQKAIFPVLALLLSCPVVRGVDNPSMTPQAERGKELFLHSAKGTACGTCHAMGDVGTAVGPDLKRISAFVSPAGLTTAIRMTQTEYVQQVKTKVGGSFPGFVKEKSGGEVQVWDLSKQPPELRTFKEAEIDSMHPNEKWKHPPTAAGYTQQELADLIGFLKWATKGSTTEVKASEVPQR